MKQLTYFILLFAIVFGLTACNENKHNESHNIHIDGVEVLYFHGKQRCPTCQAIEKETKELIDSQFRDAVKNGKVRFRVVDITKPENEALADKYEITWSSLVLVKYDNGKEISENLTQFAFANALSNPAQFKEELATKINQMLN